MKTKLLTILLLISITLFGQKKRAYEDEILFESTVAMQELINYDLKLYDAIAPGDLDKMSPAEKVKREYAIEIKKKILNRVIRNYDELIKNYPKSKLLFRALSNKGFVEFHNEDFNNAKITFERILNSSADDFEKFGRGSGIMAEPYTNYKNTAAGILAEIAIIQKNYNQAITYLDLTQKYRYNHFCGNALEDDRINTATQYAKCYIAMNDDAKAMTYLLPNLIENGLADNSEVVHLAYNQLIKKYSKEELKSKFETAFKNHNTEKREDGHSQFYILFMDTKIPLEDWNLYAVYSDKEFQVAMNKFMTETEFYKLIVK